MGRLSKTCILISYQIITAGIMMKLVLVLTLLLPFLYAQELCPVLQQSSMNQCSDTCIEDMQHKVSISRQFSDYRTYLKSEYEKFIWSECHGCIYLFCGFVQQAYGISMSRDTCT